MRPVRIGMIGYGGIGRVHAMGYRSLPFHYGLTADSIQLVGVATTRPETAQAAAGEIGCEYWTDDYHQLLARPDVEAVDICVPNHMHAEIVHAAAAAGNGPAYRPQPHHRHRPGEEHDSVQMHDR